MSKAELQQVGRMIKEVKIFEKRIGYKAMINHSRLPWLIKVRHGFKVYKYRLQFGDLDDSVYISYSDERIEWNEPHKVLMHYNEATLKSCITKAWRHLSEHGIKAKGPVS